MTMSFVRPAGRMAVFLATLAIARAGEPVPMPGPGGAPERETILLRSKKGHGGGLTWTLAKAGDIAADGTALSKPGPVPGSWADAIVPGTVLNSLVADGIYPEPYFGLNNAHEQKLIPDLSEAGREFYTYWFRTEFEVPAEFAGRRVWLLFDGINYRAEFWCNGTRLGDRTGMFHRSLFDVTDLVTPGRTAALAVRVEPPDFPGGFKAKRDKPLAAGENRNGGDGEIGKNTTMLMTVGWDFTFPDGIRDRNTGLWRDVKLFATGPVRLQHPFVRSELPLPRLDSARVRVSVDAVNATPDAQSGEIRLTSKSLGLRLVKPVALGPKETRTFEFAPDDFPELVVKNPRLWWPFHKGDQVLHDLEIEFVRAAGISDRVCTRLGIRDIRSDCATPDGSRRFLVNGRPLFLHGSNWIPEAMCRTSEERTYAELVYTRQAGVNFLRFWGGGTTESDYFFDLCDELGILVWTEFWQTGDTKIPVDTETYRANVADTVRRIRTHASLAYYVSANERKADGIVPIADLLADLDPTRGWQAGSETDGIHDGSPYKTVNPMWYYEDSASERGSRINGFCPEYGCPILPTVDCLREMMDAKDLWPVNRTVWDYLDGGGFHLMTTDYDRCVRQYGLSDNLEDYAWKAQMFGGLAWRAIWECWNRNRFEHGDRFSTGLLFWFHNSPNRQVCGRLWDWSLEPTAALYFSQDAHEPLHAQFDFLKNTVSVNNEWPRAFPGCRVTARALGPDSRELLRADATVDVPADRVLNDVLKIDWPADLPPVHFLRLDLADAKGAAVADTFYWRSNQPYRPRRTWTGPQYAGFAEINRLPPADLKVAAKAGTRNGRPAWTVELANPSTQLAFMVWTRLQDAKTGAPVRPAFYDDNFITLLPGESRAITVDWMPALEPGATRLVVEGWNTPRYVLRDGAVASVERTVRRVVLPPAEPEPAAAAAPAAKPQTKDGIRVTSSAAEHTADLAVDGNPETRWASGRTDDQWIALDFGAPRRIGRVGLNWEAAYGRAYKLQVSDDGRTWRDVLHVTDGKGGRETRTFPPVTARHLRLLGLQRGTKYGYSLWEIDVFPE